MPPDQLTNPDGPSPLRSLVEDDSAQAGRCRAKHFLFAPTEVEPSLVNVNNFTPSEPHQAHELLELLDGLPPARLAHPRVAILGAGWRAAELCAFCELAGVETTWLVEPDGDGKGFQAQQGGEVMAHLRAAVKRRGNMVVFIESRSVHLESRSPNSGEEGSDLYVCVSSASWGPFDIVVRATDPQAPAPQGAELLPFARVDTTGRLLPDTNGGAGQQLWIVGVAGSADVGFAPEFMPGPLGCPERPPLVMRARSLASRLVTGGDGNAELAAGPDCGFRAGLCWPVVGLTGLSEAQARGRFLPPDWSVEVCFSDHELPPGVPGRFSVGLITARRLPDVGPPAEGEDVNQFELGPNGVPKNGSNDEVVGAAVLVDVGGLGLLSGLMLGLEAAFRAGARMRHVKDALAPYTRGGGAAGSTAARGTISALHL